MKLRLGIVGLSADWDQRYLPALKMLSERFEVAAIYSSVASRGLKAAREFDAQQHDGFREMIRLKDIDAVLMLDSDWYGTAPINAACQYGKAIYCGSDVEIAPDRALELRRAVDSAGIAFMAEFPRRFAPASLRLKELIATRLGKPQIIFCHRRMPITKPLSRAVLNRELVELMDWTAFIAGRRIHSIHATSHQRKNEEIPDYLALSLDLSDIQSEHTTIAQVSCGSYIPPTWHEAANFRPPSGMQVRCENGVAFLDLPSSLIWFDEAGRHQEALDAEIPVGQHLLSQFHRSVTSLVRKMADLEDICRGLHALQLVEESIAEGKRMDMNADS